MLNDKGILDKVVKIISSKVRLPVPHNKVLPPHREVPPPHWEVPVSHSGMCHVPNAVIFYTNPPPYLAEFWNFFLHFPLARLTPLSYQTYGN